MLKGFPFVIILFLFSSVQISYAQQVPKAYYDFEKHYYESDFEACIRMEKQITPYALSRKDTVAANIYFFLGDAFKESGEIERAIFYWEKERTLLGELDVKETYEEGELNIKEEYSTKLYYLSDLYLQSGNFVKAGELADLLIKADKKLYKANSEEFVSTVLSVADIYFRLDRLPDEENVLSATIKQQSKGSINEGLLLNKLGDLYTYKGEYTKAFRSLSRAIEIFKSALNEHSTPYLTARANLGILFMEQGKYPEAEDQFAEVIGKADPADPENIYFPALNNQALVYQNLGQHDKSLQLLRQLKKQDSLTIGVSHPDYAVTLTNMSTAYSGEGKYANAEKMLLEALDILKANKETNTVSYARKLNNLAKVYMFSGKLNEAIKFYEEANPIYKKVLGENNPEYATNVYNLGVAYWKKGNDEEGIKYLKNASAIRAAVLGKRHPKYAESQQKVAEYLWFRKKRKEALQTYGEVFDNYYNQIESVFPALTEEEKAKFYYNTIRPSFDKFNSFAYDYSSEFPQVMGDVYNHQINTKGVIMLATEKVKEAIYTSKDTVLINKFEYWQALKEQIAKLYSHNQSPRQLDSLLVIADEKEKELAKNSGEFARQFIRKKYSWKEVQKTLKPGEAAIEVVRYQKFIPDSAGRFNNDVIYAFLILTSKTIDRPDFIILKNGKDLENKWIKFYRNSILFNQEDAYSYKNFFEPIGDYLKTNKIEKFHLSPDGVFNQVNINTLRNSRTGKYLVDEYTISLMTSTKELIENKSKGQENHSSVLLGFPKFNMGEKKEVKLESDRMQTSGTSRGLRGGLLRYVDPQTGITVLPGTQIEIEKISKLLSGTQPKIYTEGRASEGIIKQAEAPSILHIATHGYFLEDGASANSELDEYVFNPLLKSGLILAGAENYIRTGVPVDSLGNDGILTAYEAMNLNLEGTDLVVLSACETGLGEVKNGEGVYGLQRAFKLGGAKSVIMSLWNVDDNATQDLMMLFYTEFTKHGDAQEALRWAQRKLKNKYPLPFHWGAFVLVGK
jgi:CHAT domain-containing protein/lipopolysaccharide biosynthesis regulator YciM